MNNFKNYIIIGLSILSIILWFKGCYNLKKNNNINDITKTIIIHKRDTIWAKDTLFVLKHYPKLTDSIFIHDTISTDICNYVRTYRDTTEDKNLTIYSDYIIRGKLIGSGMNYKLKIPIIIYDSTKTTITTTNELKMALYSGLEGGYKSFSPYIDFKLKKVDIGVSYDLYNKTPKIRFGYRFLAK